MTSIFRFLRPAIDAASRLVGVVVVPSWRLPTLPQEKCLRDMFRRYGIKRVIDIGANEGQFCEFIRHNVGFQGAITSFEPLPNLAAVLRVKAVADGNWEVHECALGSAPGTLELNVTQHTVFSSALEPIEHEVTEGMNRVESKVTVRLSTLDIELEDVRDLDRTFVKIDTQGFDLEVLRGAQRTLASVPALQTEVSFRPLYHGMPDYTQSIQAFGRLGFAVSDFFVVAWDSDGTAFEFDCIMQRHSASGNIS